MTLRMSSAIVAVLLFLTTAGLLWLKPKDRGAHYDDYFAKLNRILRTSGEGRPVLVLDLDRLDRNLDIVKATIRPPRQFRVVAKSLPSIPLLNYIFERSGTRHAMVFHEPSIRELALAFPDIELLLGKPMPIRAAEHFYAAFPTDAVFDPARQLQWLVDSHERLEQYAGLAAKRGVTIQVNIEIDVGLHRGGLTKPDDLLPLLATIAADPRLRFSGFMGYDAHVASAPPVLASVEGELFNVLRRYKAFVEAGRNAQPELFSEALTFNGAGSKTYMLYEPEDVLNDLALGSGLVMPTDFDVPTLNRHQAAMFIASPVLKKIEGTTIPYLEKFAPLFSWWNPNWAQTYFVYGGGWLAKYAAPQGLQDNAIYGFSTNQAIVNGSAATGLEVDDHIFLRPTQSEQVLQMFGDIVVVRGGEIVGRWPVMAW